MAKIPKGLSDKDMVKDYQEEETIESVFLAAEKAADRKRRTGAGRTASDIHIAYLTPDIVDKLGKLLLELKLDLYQEGIKDYHIRLRREGKDIILSPVEAKK